MDIIEKISVFSSKLTVQYIHKKRPSLDSDRVLDLKNLFKKVYLSDGLEQGWKDYHAILVETKKFPDLIITDIPLTRKNSYVFQKIFIENRNQAIIVISDFSEKEYLENYIELGINYMLLEPVSIQQFNSVLARASENIFHRKWEKRRRKEMDEEIEKLKKEVEDIRGDLEYSMKIVEDLMNKDLNRVDNENNSCKSIKNITLINHDEGIKRMGGDEELYKELLDGFCKYYKDSVNSMKNALNDDNMEELASLAHGVKGASGNISATYLFDIAKELELIAKDNGSKRIINYLIMKFEKAFKELCSCVNSLKSS